VSQLHVRTGEIGRHRGEVGSASGPSNARICCLGQQHLQSRELMSAHVLLSIILLTAIADPWARYG
jgi:hypothetical protein